MVKLYEKIVADNKVISFISNILIVNSKLHIKFMWKIKSISLSNEMHKFRWIYIINILKIINIRLINTKYNKKTKIILI
jgi:hypothetical protein